MCAFCLNLFVFLQPPIVPNQIFAHNPSLNFAYQSVQSILFLSFLSPPFLSSPLPFLSSPLLSFLLISLLVATIPHHINTSRSPLSPSSLSSPFKEHLPRSWKTRLGMVWNSSVRVLALVVVLHIYLVMYSKWLGLFGLVAFFSLLGFWWEKVGM